jgi:putative glutamine amidotransferase
MEKMGLYIAIPEPTSDDLAYNERSLPPYLSALEAAGAIPIVIPLQEHSERVAGLLQGVHGVLLPGSGHDVDPGRYGEAPIPECGSSDPARAAMDEKLLRDAFDLRKPVLGICHGAQAMNVWFKGSLLQDIGNQLSTLVNHMPGRAVMEAHPVRIAPGSRLSQLSPGREVQLVNSSHHQAVRTAGRGLRVTAVSPEDGVIEGLELDAADHFVVGVQWHPERTYAYSDFSRSIFSAFFEAAREWQSSREGERTAG